MRMRARRGRARRACFASGARRVRSASRRALRSARFALGALLTARQLFLRHHSDRLQQLGVHSVLDLLGVGAGDRHEVLSKAVARQRHLRCNVLVGRRLREVPPLGGSRRGWVVVGAKAVEATLGDRLHGGRAGGHDLPRRGEGTRSGVGEGVGRGQEWRWGGSGVGEGVAWRGKELAMVAVEGPAAGRADDRGQQSERMRRESRCALGILRAHLFPRPNWQAEGGADSERAAEGGGGADGALLQRLDHRHGVRELREPEELLAHLLLQHI